MRRTLCCWLLCAVGFLGCDGAKPLSVPGPGAKSSDGQAGCVRVYFTTPELPPEQSQIVQALVGYIGQAQQAIDVAAFELDNQKVVEALVAAVKRGVKVRLVTETNYLGESGVTALKKAGVPVVDDQRDGALMHDKFMIFDGRSVWTGSMNFTENCAYKNNNHGIFVDDARIAANYATKFKWMFELRKFGGLPGKHDAIPNPQVMLADGTRLENYFSTHDHVADRLTAKIGESRKSIHFLAFSFTHDVMGKAMMARARTGVEVGGVFEKTQAAGGYAEFGPMRQAGLPVFLDANPRNMHHKVIILDGAITVAGSFNFSDSADKKNDENVLIIHCPQIAQRFEEEYRKVYDAARKADATAGR